MDIEGYLKSIKSHWPRPVGLAIAWILSLSIGVGIGEVLPNQIRHAPMLFALLLGVLATALWLIARRVPKCPEGRVGFLIAISVEDEKTQRIFQRDFVDNLEGLLRSGELAGRVWVGVVPQHQLLRPLQQDQAVALRIKTRSSFVLHGQVRTRKEGILKHYIDLSGVVGHAETADHNKKNLTGEFSELLPRRIIAEEGSELPTFELTSALSSLVAKYIAGIAAYLSGLLDHAQQLYNDAETLAKRAAGAHPIAQKILDRLPTRRSELVITRARALYESWVDTRANSLLVAMDAELNKAPERAHELGEWKTLKAISLVASSGDDLSQIERLVEKLPDADPVTHMNKAFFDVVVRGDLRSAARRYRRAHELNVTVTTIEEVMSFLDWYKEYRPRIRCEVSYALGFIALHLLNDKALAKGSFDEFDQLRDGRYDTEAALVRKWM